MYLNPRNLIIGLVILVLLIGGGYFLLNRNNVLVAANSSISGEVDLNGSAPTGATISVLVREQGQGDFLAVVSGIAAEDKVDWSWNSAKANANYEVRAQLMQNGQTLATSPTLLVTAPASSEELTLNYSPSEVSASPTPAASAQASPTPTPAPQASKITGSIDLNGYIPSGATISIEQRVKGQSQFNLVGSAFNAQDGETWLWREPVAGTTYDIKAVLRDGAGNRIGESHVTTVTAPASNQALAVNSTATPPAPATGTISGSVNLNGVAPQNSSIVILQRVNGTNNYQVAVSGVQAANGSQWSWNQAQSGTTYQLLAVLKQQNQNGTQSDVAYSQSLIAAAPATGEVFTINSNVNLPAPTQAVTNACGPGTTSSYQVTINYPSIPGAQSYWLQVGVSNGGAELVNTVQGASNNPSQGISATFVPNQTYYARYAYSYQSGATWNSGFSSFSNTYPVHCP